MTEKSPVPVSPSSAEVAQEVLRRLHDQGIEPTPEAYETLYNELTGASAREIKFDVAMLRSARLLAKTSTDIGLKLASAIEESDWGRFSELLIQFIKEPPEENSKSTPFSGFGEETQATRFWRELLSKTMTFTLPVLLQSEPALAKRAERLGHQVQKASLRQEMMSLAVEIKNLYFHINLHGEEKAATQTAFIRLLNIMLEVVIDSIDTEGWLIKELQDFQGLLREPLDQKKMIKASQQMRDIVMKHKSK